MFAHDSLIKSCALTSNFKHASLYKKKYNKRPTYNKERVLKRKY